MSHGVAEKIDSMIAAKHALEWVCIDENELREDKTAARRFFAWLKLSPKHVRAFLSAQVFLEEVTEVAVSDKTDIEQLAKEARASEPPNVVQLDIASIERKKRSELKRSLRGMRRQRFENPWRQRQRFMNRRSFAAAFVLVMIGMVWVAKTPDYPDRIPASNTAALVPDAIPSIPVNVTGFTPAGNLHTIELALAASVLSNARPKNERPPALMQVRNEDIKTYITAAGENRTVSLADGSKVTMSGNTKVEVALGENTRRIELSRGQAHFNITNDPARPFQIQTRTAKTEVMQAAIIDATFNTNKNRRSTTVSVYEGQIRVLPREKYTASSYSYNVEGLTSAFINAGEKAFIRNGFILKAVIQNSATSVPVSRFLGFGNLIQQTTQTLETSTLEPSSTSS